MRNNQILLSALALACAASAQPASAQDSAGQNICLRSNQIDNWEVENDRTLIVTDRRDRQYRLGLIGTCTGLDNAQFQLGFESFSQFSCLRRGDSIHYNDLTFGHERCVISSIEPLDPAGSEAAAPEDEG